ncbi:MAG: transposase [Chlorobi bacterium]|nr:transposase [Chlorobiota bacterium]
MTNIETISEKTYLNKFHEVFIDDEHCLPLLSEIKWANGFVCTKCGNTNYCKGKNNYSRRCTRCKKEESATANTIFHRCKFPLKKAFEIVLLACQVPAMSSYKISDQIELRHMTCYNFRKKILNCRDKSDESDFLRKLLLRINQRISYMPPNN